MSHYGHYSPGGSAQVPKQVQTQRRFHEREQLKQGRQNITGNANFDTNQLQRSQYIVLHHGMFTWTWQTGTASMGYPCKYIYLILFYLIWFDLIWFDFIIFCPLICVYAHLVCPDFRKARLLTFSTTSNRSYTKRDEHTHPSLLPTHFSDCLATHMHIYIYYSTKGLILLCFFPFSFSLNPYERNARRTSNPQERRQRAS